MAAGTLATLNLMDETMNAHLLFPQIGKVIASTGSRHFPRMLHDLIQTQLMVDATHIRHVRVEPHSASANDATLLSETVFSEPDLPCTGLDTPARLNLSRRKEDNCYEIILYRSHPLQGFSAHERSLVEEISPLLLPMLEKHASALYPGGVLCAQPATDTQVPHSLALRFAERLRLSGLALSTRETQVCVGLLAGHTAPELAAHLQLQVSTVDSYLKRAAIKLGISGRHALTRWMYDPQAQAEAR